MQYTNAKAEVDKILNENAVQFDTDRRYNNQKAWPFLYPFIPKPYLNTDILNNGQGLLGISIPSGGSRDINVTLERDAVYRQLNVKYTPFRCALGAQIGTFVITTVSGTTAVLVDTTVGLSQGQAIAWLDDVGTINNAVIASITDATHFEVEVPTSSVSTAVIIHTCEWLWYDKTPPQQRATNPDLSGTITIAPGGAVLAGDANTLFVGELTVGDIIFAIDANAQMRFFQITVITDFQTATISETLGAGDAGIPALSTFKKVATVLTGTIDVDATARTITGAGGAVFETELTRWDTVFYPDATGVVTQLTVSDIDSDTLAKASAPATDSGGAVVYALADTDTASNVAMNPILAGQTANPITPLTQFLRVTYIMRSLRGRYLYGGTQEFLTAGDPTNGGLQERPLLVSDLQGFDDGLGMLRTAMVFPYESTITIRVINTYSEPILLNGSLFGYKIDLHGGNK